MPCRISGLVRTGLVAMAAAAATSAAQADPMLADFAYPYPVERFEFAGAGSRHGPYGRAPGGRREPHRFNKALLEGLKALGSS